MKAITRRFSACTVDFHCFTEFCGYKIFNDVDGLEPFVEEIPNTDGYFQDAVFYAIPSDSGGNINNSENTDTNPACLVNQFILAVFSINAAFPVYSCSAV